jgi:hypothetical protein
VLGRLDGTPIATGRLLLATDAVGLPHIGRVAVLARRRPTSPGHPHVASAATVNEAQRLAKGLTSLVRPSPPL